MAVPGCKVCMFSVSLYKSMNSFLLLEPFDFDRKHGIASIYDLAFGQSSLFSSSFICRLPLNIWHHEERKKKMWLSCKRKRSVINQFITLYQCPQLNVALRNCIACSTTSLSVLRQISLTLACLENNYREAVPLRTFVLQYHCN